jgi:hypothetical protein
MIQKNKKSFHSESMVNLVSWMLPNMLADKPKPVMEEGVMVRTGKQHPKQKEVAGGLIDPLVTHRVLLAVKNTCF